MSLYNKIRIPHKDLNLSPYRIYPLPFYYYTLLFYYLLLRLERLLVTKGPPLCVTYTANWGIYLIIV